MFESNPMGMGETRPRLVILKGHDDAKHRKIIEKNGQNDSRQQHQVKRPRFLQYAPEPAPSVDVRRLFRLIDRRQRRWIVRRHMVRRHWQTFFRCEVKKIVAQRETGTNNAFLTTDNTLLTGSALVAKRLIKAYSGLKCYYLSSDFPHLR
jgi:hypothetical protein